MSSSINIRFDRPLRKPLTGRKHLLIAVSMATALGFFITIMPTDVEARNQRAQKILRGALVGAAIGALIDGKRGARRGALVGGVIGAVQKGKRKKYRKRYR